MARPRRAVVAQRRRWARTRRVSNVRNMVDTSLRRTLCGEHYAEFRRGSYLRDLDELCQAVSIAEEVVDEELRGFFPPLGMTQELVRSFKIWLKDEENEPVKDECLPWCRYIIQSFLRCAACRHHAPILVDSDSDAD